MEEEARALRTLVFYRAIPRGQGAERKRKDGTLVRRGIGGGTASAWRAPCAPASRFDRKAGSSLSRREEKRWMLAGMGIG